MMKARETSKYIDEKVAAWHQELTPTQSLCEYLRMTEEEYDRWVRAGEIPQRMKDWTIKMGGFSIGSET
jgi:hypothetical protein